MMKLLTTLHRAENVNIHGKTFCREAVRGIAFRNSGAALTPKSELLMIYSSVKGDYKFPGGGREQDEHYHETLRRELCEEAGAKLLNVNGAFGKVLEYGHAKEKNFETFKMFSYYYLCEVDENLVAPTLEAYEARLGFQAVWVSIAEALETNKRFFTQKSPVPRWTKREIFVLEKLQEMQ